MALTKVVATKHWEQQPILGRELGQEAGGIGHIHSRRSQVRRWELGVSMDPNTEEWEN